MSNITSGTEVAIIVTKHRVACDGGGGVLGHPKVWLDMGQDTKVRCKYCNQLFRLDQAGV
ncbi:MAG: zinc-finger domain-containing protein, partial [Hyphomonadaceae bacterium]|nr:zinc-finger domain-containing protein [Hyphomonadaceae bacterium]